MDERERVPWVDATTKRPTPVRRLVDAPQALTLTIAHHADAARVGLRAVLSASAACELSRLRPVFADAAGRAPLPLADVFVSRRPVLVEPEADGGVRLRRSVGGMSLLVDGLPVSEAARIEPARVRAGVVILLAERVVLVLRRSAAPAPLGPRLGLVGESDCMEELRRDIALVAPYAVATLVRGESGAGKELVARAIHEQSARAGGPYVAVNVAAIPPTTAVSQLFGHVRGAFSGATVDHPGYFGMADGGTLFLDEVGAMPPELQVMLLRTLETGEVQPVGARRPRSVDVRVVSATDADLEAAAERGDFRPPLLHRLTGFQLVVPPLRERREDIGRLLLHFLLGEPALAAMWRREASDPSVEPWLPAPVVERLVRASWPGNVRQLRNAARHLAIAAIRSVPLRMDARLEQLLAEPAAPAAASEPAEATRPSELDEETVLRALRDNGYGVGATAKALGIARSSLYAFIEQSPRSRKAGDLTREEVVSCGELLGQDVSAMAASLQVSRQGLLKRMRELGVAR